MVDSKRTSSAILPVDVVGGTLMVMLLAAITWHIMGPHRLTYAELDDLSIARRKNQGELGQIGDKLEDARKLLAVLQGRLSEADTLPFRSLVEKDLNTLNVLAQANRVQITRVTPLPSQQYPGLLEIRVACDANGAMPDIVNFLRAVETHPFWMDIGYLNVQQPQQAFNESASGGGKQSLTFVVSLFSSESSGMVPADTDKPTSRVETSKRRNVETSK